MQHVGRVRYHSDRSDKDYHIKGNAKIFSILQTLLKPRLVKRYRAAGAIVVTGAVVVVDQAVLVIKVFAVAGRVDADLRQAEGKQHQAEAQRSIAQGLLQCSPGVLEAVQEAIAQLDRAEKNQDIRDALHHGGNIAQSNDDVVEQIVRVPIAGTSVEVRLQVVLNSGSDDGESVSDHNEGQGATPRVSTRRPSSSALGGRRRLCLVHYPEWVRQVHIREAEAGLVAPAADKT